MAALKFLTDARTVQSFINRRLNLAKPMPVDGIYGKNSKLFASQLVLQEHDKDQTKFGSRLQDPNVKSIAGLSDQTILTIVEQMMLNAFFPKDPPLVLDGIGGPQTSYYTERYQNAIRDLPTPSQLSPVPTANSSLTKPGFVKPDFGRQKDMIANFGNPADERNLIRLETPYPLYLDWKLDQSVKSFLIHKKVADSARAAMESVLEHYGVEEIHKLGLDQFGGCYNPRKMRGGSSWSMHAWGVAIDWDADRNPLRAGWGSARFLTYKPTFKFLDIWEAHGWTSLGRVRGYDAMHVQAPRL